MRRSAPVLAALSAALTTALTTALLCGCHSAQPNREPVGELFPTAVGTSLDGTRVEVPTVWRGMPTVVLVGYVQEAQFDADRWMLGLLQAGAAGMRLRIVELPTIPSRIASLFDDTIDQGMRNGIPPEDWASVVTVYGAAARPIAAFTGTERPRTMRVLLLDASGRVVWFHDEGYSPRELLDLLGAAAALESPGL
jgi:hypothetical protein